MTRQKTIIEEYFSLIRLKIWELMWESKEMSFVVPDECKNIKKEIRWFIKNKFLIKKKEKGEITYTPNLKNSVVMSVIGCFNQCINIEINKEIEKQDARKRLKKAKKKSSERKEED